ncbi:MAG TPA: M20 family metallopeptidase [Ktedonobacteraceae bacterium]
MDIHTLVTEVKAYTQRHLPQYINELTQLCAIDSPSSHKPGLDEIAGYLRGRMRDLGMNANVIERGAYGNDVLGILHGGGKGTMLLLGHTDTVYPLGTAAARPARVEDDIIYGPGVNDMRGGILSGIYAIEALLSIGYHSFGEIRFLCVSDEEIEDRHSEDLLGEASQNCQVALVLEAARANGDIVSARKGLTNYTLSVRGRSAHSGVEPERGVNALVELSHQILQFQSLNGWRDGVTINIGVASGGTVWNVVPDFAEAHIEMRYILPQDRIDTEMQWRKMMQHKLLPNAEIELDAEVTLRSHPMVCTPESLALAQQAQNIAQMLDFSVNHVLTGGASDANWTSNYGVPSLDGLGPIGGFDHSPDEYLVLSSVPDRTALFAGLIAKTGA